jgi:small subunit ribosomal protein S6
LKTVVNKKLYEAMFLVDSAEASADWDGVNSAIKKILERAGAEIISMRKWDELRLAYEIDGKARGTYILCYFRAEGEKLRDVERDVQLSERIMRVLILCAEHLTQEDVEKDTPFVQAEKHKQKAAQAPKEGSGTKRPEQEELEDSKENEQKEEEKDGEEADRETSS